MTSNAIRTGTAWRVRSGAPTLGVPPSAPLMKTVDVGAEEILIGWAPPLALNGGILDYQITVSPGGITATLPTSPLTRLTGGLTTDVQHTVTLKARNAAGYGPAVTITATPTGNTSLTGLTRVPSFGPNGTHWVPNTPLWGDDTIAHTVVVDCTWPAIAAAIGAATSQQVTEGMRILVRPGSLSGNGSGSTSKAVMSLLGSASWSNRILVRPRDGWGTVTVDAAARVSQVHGVVLAGFQTVSWRSDGCLNGAIARFLMRGQSTLSVQPTPGAGPLTGFRIVEFVARDQFIVGVTDSTHIDKADCWTSSNLAIDGAVFDGCFLAPHWRQPGSPQHIDTLQFEPFGAYVTNALIRDCAFFGSSNSATQVNGLQSAEFRHSYICENTACTNRFPPPTGAEVNDGHALNGDTAGLMVTDGTFILGNASLGTRQVARPLALVDSSTIKVPPQVIAGKISTVEPLSGAWIIDTTLDDNTHPQAPPQPDDAYLASIWGG